MAYGRTQNTKAVWDILYRALAEIGAILASIHQTVCCSKRKFNASSRSLGRKTKSAPLLHQLTVDE